MAYYNSWMHKKHLERKEYSFEERTERKKERIKAKIQAKTIGEGAKPNPFRGMLRMLDFLKRRNRNAQETIKARVKESKKEKRP